MMRTNKRGQTPILMLFAVAIVLVLIALMSFWSMDKKFGNLSRDNSNLLAEVNSGEHLVIAISKYAAQAAAGQSDIVNAFKNAALTKQNIFINWNFIDKIKNNAFKFEKIGEGYRLQMEKAVVEGKLLTVKGEPKVESNIQRIFNLCMEFNAKGQFVKNCPVAPVLP